jgi:hypothetical protein
MDSTSSHSRVLECATNGSLTRKGGRRGARCAARWARDGHTHITQITPAEHFQNQKLEGPNQHDETYQQVEYESYACGAGPSLHDSTTRTKLSRAIGVKQGVSGGVGWLVWLASWQAGKMTPRRFGSRVSPLFAASQSQPPSFGVSEFRELVYNAHSFRARSILKSQRLFDFHASTQGQAQATHRLGVQLPSAKLSSHSHAPQPSL